MLNINPQVIRVGLIGLGATLLIYALNVAEDTTSDFSNDMLNDQQNQKPSAYLTESTFHIFSVEGKLSKLYAKKAFFFSNHNDIAINSPEFSTSNSNSTMQLTADIGHYNPTEETLLLEGNVIAKQVTKNNSSWELLSEKLNLDNRLGSLSTAEKVTITNGNHTLSAIGFEGSINQKEIKLLSKVRGKYVFTN